MAVNKSGMRIQEEDGGGPEAPVKATKNVDQVGKVEESLIEFGMFNTIIDYYYDYINACLMHVDSQNRKRFEIPALGNQ